MDHIKQIRIFIASPGDVKAERDCIERVAENLRKDPLLADRVTLKTDRWENVCPQAGRPQEIINEYVRKCDIFIGMLHRRFGMPTGKEESGTYEEFKIAYAAWETTGTPQILFYFKDVTLRSAADFRDEQLMKVLQFKETIETNHLLLAGNFATPAELEEKIENDLKEAVKKWERKESEPKVMIAESRETVDISAYLNWIEQRCGQMDLQKLANQPIIASLPELFVPLLTDDPDSSARVSFDIEELVRKNEYLLIAGDPGCGKSTLLKQIALKMKRESGNDSFELPVLVFLRDCIPYFKENSNKTFSAEEILNTYFSEHEGMLSSAVVRHYCEKKNALFLIDGLDEVPDDKQDRVIRAFAEFRNKYAIHMVLTGRKHSVLGEAMLWFGKKYVKIHPFNEEQIKLFVNRWCEHIFVKRPTEGRKSAEELCLELQSHEAVSALIENPLMLTTVCILYYEGEKLPEQRAELYRKFVENLVKRRFVEADRFLEILKGFGFKMQESGEKGIGRNDALAIVKKTFRPLKDEDLSDYNRRIAAIFDEFEPQCGLLRLEDGIYRFWHLTFQEYLAAEYLIATSEEPVKAIEPYLSNEQYRETVRLYIGCLSLNQKNVAAKIIRNVLQRQDASVEEILLVGEALVDIKKERRDELLTGELQQRYWEVINQDSISRKRKAELGEIIGWIGDERDLMEFVKIKGGTYSLEDFRECTILPFSISKYPVTNHWFAEFVKAGGYENKEFWSDEGWQFRDENQIRKPEYWGERELGCPNLPVVGISWHEAVAFTSWLNVSKYRGYSTYRLPEEQEWQAAAAGKDNRTFPWGNEFDVRKLNCGEGEDCIVKISSVGILSNGDTPEGVSDLAGNVWEWTSTKDSSIPVLRGGSWDDGAKVCLCACRNFLLPGLRVVDIGFRVVFLP